MTAPESFKIKIIIETAEHERFAPNAFADALGFRKPGAVVDWETKRPLTETLVEAKVADDGRSAELTLEFDGHFLPPADPRYSVEL